MESEQERLSLKPCEGRRVMSAKTGKKQPHRAVQREAARQAALIRRLTISLHKVLHFWSLHRDDEMPARMFDEAWGALRAGKRAAVARMKNSAKGGAR